MMNLQEELGTLVKREAEIEAKGPAAVLTAKELRYWVLIRRASAAQHGDAREVLQLATDLGFEMQRVQADIEQRAAVCKLEACVAAKATNLTRINDAGREVEQCEQDLKRTQNQIRELNRQADAARVALTRVDIAAEKLTGLRQDYPCLFDPILKDSRTETTNGKDA